MHMIPELDTFGARCFLKKKQSQQANLVTCEKRLGNTAYQKKDYDKALVYYNKAMSIDNTNTVVACNLSAVYFMKKDYWRCVDYGLKALMTAEDNDTTSSTILKCCLRLATSFKNVGDLENARDYYVKAKHFQEAEKIKNQLLQITPKDRVMNKKAGKKEYVAGNNDLALVYYTNAIQGGMQDQNDAKLYSKRASIFSKLNLFWLGILDCEKGTLLNPQSQRIRLIRGVLFYKLDIFFHACLDLNTFYPKNEKVKGYLSSITEKMKNKPVCYQPKLPDFAREYQEVFPTNTIDIKILEYYFSEMNFRILEVTDGGSIIDTLTNFVEERFQNESSLLKRFGTVMHQPKFFTMFKKLSLGAVIPIIQKDESKNTNLFQSMKNVCFPSHNLYYGENHVSIGCVDFSELLFAHYIKTEKNGYLNFVGIDSSVCSIARCWILRKMVENNSDSRSILQVWFSSAWSRETKEIFVEACSNLLKESSLETNILKLVRFWKTDSLTVSEATERWGLVSKLCNQNAIFDTLSNMRHKVDRVDYARYLFTGLIFVTNESNLYCGNSTMFSSPDKTVYSKFNDENFYFAFNFADNRFVYESSLKLSMEKFMFQRMENLKLLFLEKKIDMEFKCGEISATNCELLEYVKCKNAYTMNWSNLMDYFSKDNFIKMIKYVSRKETVSYFHVMNWLKFVKGASLIDYEFDGKKAMIGHILNHFFSRHLGNRIINCNYAQIWDFQINTFNIMNVADEVLSMYVDNYLKVYFEDQAEFKIIGENGEISRSQTTCYGSFKIL